MSGSQRWSSAKLLRNWSPGPNTTEGRNTVTASSFCAARTQASPSPFERRYWLGPSAWACKALICSMRGTRFFLHASTIFCGSSTWARANSGPKGRRGRPCKMPTKFTTASQPIMSFASVSGSCTSASTTSTVGRRFRCLARSRLRVGTTTKCSSSTSWRTRCRPTKPLPPMTRMRLMVPPGKAASLTAKRALQGARPMLPEKSLLNDGFVAYCRHAFRGAARQDRAQARLQRRRLGPENGGVVDGVHHDFLDVVARLAERNGLDEDRPFDRNAAAPKARARRPGVVGGRREHGAAVELVEDMPQIVRAERSVEIRLVQPRPGEILHAHSLRDPLRRRAHHLHQTGRAGGGFRARDETAFLAHHPQHPRLVEIARARFFGEHFAIRRKVAH